ncbi:MAG: indolepyruvate ferredoxin oxidoreductase, partial [Candidatus Aminicenantes bacterium]|nr:indolepyruvate ferredoxin oxidoreductase [Candidatus Aminicenantes bacterium]
SQNEQDSRYYAQFGQIFCFEPSNHQEAYDMTRKAFDLSESCGIPVMIRMVTRLAHSRSQVQPRPPRKQNAVKYGERSDWTLLPVNARRRFKILAENQNEFVKISEESEFNTLDISDEIESFAVITSGIAYNYVLENYADSKKRPSILKVTSYPLPKALIGRLIAQSDTVLIVEEGYPFLEKNLTGLFGIHGKDVKGKLTGHLPLTGELSPEIVRQALELSPRTKRDIGDFPIAGRPPQLCQGCGHRDTYDALNSALKSYSQGHVFSDIGCYTLGALPPYNAIESCVCMGASISMAKGGAEAGVYPSVAVIGDSTFAHSGITPLLDAATVNTDMTVLILDNATVAMTGGQPTFATGDKLVRIIEGLGVPGEHIRKILPLPKNLDENTRIINEEIDYHGLSVIIAARECVQQARKNRS